MTAALAALISVTTGAYAQADASDNSAPAGTKAIPDAGRKLPWLVGPMEISGYIDGYLSYNANQPAESANNRANDLYDFNDKAGKTELSEARLTLNHDPTPVGARFDFIYGRTNSFINAGAADNYIEQAYVSVKPPRAHGFEADLGKFVTSAGAEVAEARDNWNYSRSLLFSWAIPYTHTGLRAFMPVTKAETVGVQVVNGWNSSTKNNGWVTIGLISAYVRPKYTWNLNVYTGPQHTAHGYRNLVDTTLYLTPTPKFSAGINFDYGQNRDAIVKGMGDTSINSWNGIALAARAQVNDASALAARYEHFNDTDGFATGTAQHLNEVTGTYEYRFPELPNLALARIEYRRDMSNVPVFHKGRTGFVDAQSTFTVAVIVSLPPQR